MESADGARDDARGGGDLTTRRAEPRRECERDGLTWVAADSKTHRMHCEAGSESGYRTMPSNVTGKSSSASSSNRRATTSASGKTHPDASSPTGTSQAA